MEIYKQGHISVALYAKYKIADYNLILNCSLLNAFLYTKLNYMSS